MSSLILVCVPGRAHRLRDHILAGSKNTQLLSLLVCRVYQHTGCVPRHSGWRNTTTTAPTIARQRKKKKLSTAPPPRLCIARCMSRKVPYRRGGTVKTTERFVHYSYLTFRIKNPSSYQVYDKGLEKKSKGSSVKKNKTSIHPPLRQCIIRKTNTSKKMLAPPPLPPPPPPSGHMAGGWASGRRRRPARRSSKKRLFSPSLPSSSPPPSRIFFLLVRLWLVGGGDDRNCRWVRHPGDRVHDVVHGGEGVEGRAHDGLSDSAGAEEPCHEGLALRDQVSLEEVAGRVAQVPL